MKRIGHLLRWTLSTMMLILFFNLSSQSISLCNEKCNDCFGTQDEFDPTIIAGKWKWVEGQELEVFANGTSKTWLNGNQINSGTWVCTDKGERRYTFRLDQGGWVDEIVLSSDYSKLTGKNQQGLSLSGYRISPLNVFDSKAIAGRWKWVEGQELEVFANGTSKTWLNGNQINSGTWTCTNKGERRYTFRLDQGGWVDEIVLSSDYNKLTGKNQQGLTLSGYRISASKSFDPKVIAGKWKWVEGQVLEIFANGTSKTWLNGNQINSGTWVCTDKGERRYTFRLDQGGWVDEVVLTSDCNTLSGKNQAGLELRGERIR